MSKNMFYDFDFWPLKSNSQSRCPGGHLCWIWDRQTCIYRIYIFSHVFWVYPRVNPLLQKVKTKVFIKHKIKAEIISRHFSYWVGLPIRKHSLQWRWGKTSRSDEAANTPRHLQEQRCNSAIPKSELFVPQLWLEILFMKVTYRIVKKGKPWWSSTLTKISSDLLPKTTDTALILLQKEWMASSIGSCTPYSCRNPLKIRHNYLRDLCQGYGWVFP